MIRFSAPLHRQILPELQLIDVWSALAIPSFKVVGLPGQEIIESCERVRAAIEASGMEFPRRRVLVNLSPAGVRKQGTGTDLAIALAVIHSSCDRAMGAEDGGAMEKERDRLIVASGELGLDGSIRSAGRVLRACHAAIESGATDLVLAAEDSETARRGIALIEEVRGVPVKLGLHLVARLEQVADLLERPIPPPPGAPEPLALPAPPTADLLPLEPGLERTITLAAAGAHHLLLLGPRGTGKTASLHWLHCLQSRLAPADLLQRLLLDELVDPARPRFDQRAPVRILPPQLRPEALVGGFQRGELRPGEFSQAHGGTLVADEFLEWPRDSRECLRDPMESGVVHLARAQRSLEIPARFQLAASANLCRCGGWPRAWSSSRERLAGGRPALCTCPDLSHQDYLSRLSGPILDRIDLVKLVLHRPGLAGSAGDRPQPEILAEKTGRTRELLQRLWGAPSARLDGARVEEILRGEPSIARDWSAIRRSSEASLRRRHKEIRVALTMAAWDHLHRGLSRPVPGRALLEEARDASADQWLPTLSQTRLRFGRQAESASRASPANSSVDPPGPAV